MTSSGECADIDDEEPNSGLGHRSGGKRTAISMSMYWRMGIVAEGVGRQCVLFSRTVRREYSGNTRASMHGGWLQSEASC